MTNIGQDALKILHFSHSSPILLSKRHQRDTIIFQTARSKDVTELNTSEKRPKLHHGLCPPQEGSRDSFVRLFSLPAHRVLSECSGFSRNCGSKTWKSQSAVFLFVFVFIPIFFFFCILKQVFLMLRIKFSV